MPNEVSRPVEGTDEPRNHSMRPIRRATGSGTNRSAGDTDLAQDGPDVGLGGGCDKRWTRDLGHVRDLFRIGEKALEVERSKEFTTK